MKDNELIKYFGTNNEEVAKLTGVHASSVSHICNNKSGKYLTKMKPRPLIMGAMIEKENISPEELKVFLESKRQEVSTGLDANFFKDFKIIY